MNGCNNVIFSSLSVQTGFKEEDRKTELEMDLWSGGGCKDIESEELVPFRQEKSCESPGPTMGCSARNGIMNRIKLSG